MADEEPGVIRITDHTGGIGRGWSDQKKGRLLIWGASVVVIGALILSSLPRKTQPSAAPAPTRAATPPTSAQPIQVSADMLRRAEEEARDRAASEPRQPQRVPDTPTKATGRTAQTDTMATDRAKRRYESLLASPVVVSRRAASDQPVGDADVRRTASPRRQEATVTPTIDETAEAVVRASQRAGLAPSAGQPAVTPVTSPVTPPGDRPRPGPTGPIDPAGPLHTLLESTWIDGTLTMRLDNSSNSPVKVLVTNPVYSHASGIVLIPGGSFLVGETKRTTSYGEDRAAVTFHRLIFPDGSTIPLNGMPGMNQAGDLGLKDKVNRHLASTIGISAAVGAVTGLGQMVSGVGRAGDNSTVVVAGQMADSTSQATQQVLGREMNRPWTITIREGKRVRVWLNEDLSLPAYLTTKAR